MKSSRQTAVELLASMEQYGSYSNIALDNALTAEKLSARDKAFATALFYGAIERKMTLDYIIRLYSSVEFDKIEIDVLQILRLGIYQLLYTSVPESAAVNESVNLAPQRAKGFVNGILRGFIRSGKEIDYKDLTGIPKLSIEYSCPKWLIKKWTDDYGEEKTLGILKSSFGRPPLFVRVNTLKTTSSGLIENFAKENISAVKNSVTEDCLELGSVSGIEGTNAYRKGLFHVQDLSSQLCCKVVKPMFNETVLDVCAAPGGKTFTMAQLMADRGKIYSFDIYDGRVSMIKESLSRLGITIVEAQLRDALEYDPDFPKADKVLCDVVCSGLGVIRRKPEIKYKRPKNIEELPMLQLNILEASSKYVKSGGKLVYSTCTLNKEENEGVAQAFLEKNPDFTPVVVPLGISGIEETSMRTFFPSEVGGDGFFCASFRRK